MAGGRFGQRETVGPREWADLVDNCIAGTQGRLRERLTQQRRAAAVPADLAPAKRSRLAKTGCGRRRALPSSDVSHKRSPDEGETPRINNAGDGCHIVRILGSQAIYGSMAKHDELIPRIKPKTS